MSAAAKAVFDTLDAAIAKDGIKLLEPFEELPPASNMKYHTTVRQPLAMSTVRRDLCEDPDYSLRDLRRDILKIVANTRRVFKTDSVPGKHAMALVVCER